MDAIRAVEHLRGMCVVPDASEAALLATWEAAKARLGPPSPNAGRPRTRALPSQHRAYIEELMRRPWARTAFRGGERLEMVEIAPLITGQFYVDVSRVEFARQRLSAHPDPDEIVAVCLPLDRPNRKAEIQNTPSGLTIRYPSGEGRILVSGVLSRGESDGTTALGIVTGAGSPLIQVTRFDQRYYVFNGHHRLTALAQHGVEEAACVVTDTDDLEAALRPQHRSLFERMAESADPPTVRHYGTGRALPVMLRAYSRVFDMTWSSRIVPED